MKPNAYTIKSRVRTTGLADIFVNYDMHLNAEGKTTANGLKTTKYVSQNKDGKKDRRVEVNVTDTGFTMTAKPRFGNLGDRFEDTAVGEVADGVDGKLDIGSLGAGHKVCERVVIQQGETGRVRTIRVGRHGRYPRRWRSSLPR